MFLARNIRGETEDLQRRPITQSKHGNAFLLGAIASNIKAGARVVRWNGAPSGDVGSATQ